MNIIKIILKNNRLFEKKKNKKCSNNKVSSNYGNICGDLIYLYECYTINSNSICISRFKRILYNMIILMIYWRMEY